MKMLYLKTSLPKMKLSLFLEFPYAEDGEDDGDLPPKAKRAKVSENISAQEEQILVEWFSENQTIL
jgi:hypothetical protein